MTKEKQGALAFNIGVFMVLGAILYCNLIVGIVVFGLLLMIGGYHAYNEAKDE